MKKLAFVVLTGVLGACSLLPQQENVVGTFQGDLPCADCQKIQAKLTLNADNTYRYDTVYFKNGKQHAFSDKGSYTVDKANKDVIRLDQASGNLAFKVSQNQVEVCDAEGNTVKQPNSPYVLRKVLK